MIEPGRAAQSRKFYITDDPQTISVPSYASHLSQVAAINGKEVPATRMGDAHYRWHSTRSFHKTVKREILPSSDSDFGVLEHLYFFKALNLVW
jgi:hypothetical protein